MSNSYVRAQNKWLQENGVAVGSQVKITCAAMQDEQGWDNAWTGNMDDAIGKIGTVTEIDGVNGIRVVVGASDYEYPYFVLETMPVPAVVPFNGTLEVGQWYETNAGQRLYCQFRTHHDTYPMVVVQEDGCVDTYMEKGLWIEDYNMDDECSIALQLVGCTGFDWTKPVPPAVVPEPEPVDTLPEPPAGWQYVAEDEVLVNGDVYMQPKRELADMTEVQSALGETIKKLQEHGTYWWHEDWVGVIRKLPSPDPVLEGTKLRLQQIANTRAINDLCKTIHSKNVEAGWWDAADNPLIVPTKLGLIHSEVSEALEGHRKGLKDDKLPEYDMIAVELADVLIRTFDLAGFLGIELGTIMEAKEKFNSSRSDHKPEVRKAQGGKAY